MNKRIFNILLPVLALILTAINCTGDYIGFSNPADGYSISAAHQSRHPYSVNLNKETNRKHKNAIRIKAWDDAAAMVAPTAWNPVAINCYFEKAYCCYYNAPVLSSRFSRHKLRGPPVA